MNRLAIATLVVSVVNLAHADTPAPTGPAEPDTCAADKKRPGVPRCDEIADVESQEANLESNERRKGFSFAFAIGGDIMVGGDIGVGRGPWISLRLGHVATRKTNVTFEATIGSGLHKAAATGPTLTDSNAGLFVGAQRYLSRSFWVRPAGGLTILVKNTMSDGTGGDKPIFGVGGLVGAGYDLARFGRYVPVISFEVFAMTSVSGDGLKLQLGMFGFGFSYY